MSSGKSKPTELEIMQQQYEELKARYKMMMLQQNDTVERRQYRFLQHQNVQQTRQIQYLSKMAELRRDCVQDVCNIVYGLMDQYPDQKEHLQSVVQRIEVYRIESDSKSIGFALSDNKFLDSVDESDLTVLQKQDYGNLNLSSLAGLEDKLSDLYRQLYKLDACVTNTLLPSISDAVSGFSKVTRDAVISDIQRVSQSIAKIRSELIELEMVVPSKNEKKPGMKWNTKRIVKDLPKFSRRQHDCENYLCKFIQHINQRDYAHELEKDALREEMEYHKKSFQFMKNYTIGLFKQIEQINQQFFPSPERPTSTGENALLMKLHKVFSNFDTDSNQENLKELLFFLKTNQDDLYRLGNGHSHGEKMQKMHIDMTHFSRELDIIKSEFEQKMQELLCKQNENYQRMDHDRFSNFEPYFVPAGKAKEDKLYRDIKTVPQPIKKSSSDAGNSKKTKKSKANPVSSNIVEMKETMEQLEQRVIEMEGDLKHGELTQMQKYAMKKSIAREKAALKRAQRTFKQLTE